MYQEMKIEKTLMLKWITLSLLFIFLSCKDENEGYDSYKGIKHGMISFSIRTPSDSPPRQDEVNEPNGNEIKTIEILLFDTHGYTKEPIYCNEITENEFNNSIKTFSVKIPEGTYDIVILANSRAALTSILDDIQEGNSKESVLERLIVTNNTKWNTDASSGTYMPIPLWGEKTSVTIASETSHSVPINLVRMMSKIDVALTTEIAKNNFKLKSIRLYNYNNKGRITPASDNWNGESVIAPSIPNGAEKPENPEQNPLVYDNQAITIEDIACLNEIYAFEASAGSSSALQENTCLVIGGIYKDDNSPTYYRIDFAQTTSTSITYLALRRNHHYKVDINEISGSGLTTPEEAFKALPVNIKAEVLDWDEVHMSDVVTDGQYLLTVSQGKFLFSKESRTTTSEDNTLSITSDYPTGWSIDKVVGTANTNITWLKTNKTNGATGETTEVSLILDENTTGYTRSGFIHLNAGRLTYVVEVVQNTQWAISLVIKDAEGQNEIEELIFGISKSAPPFPKQFIVQWEPVDALISITRETFDGKAHFEFAPSSEKPGLDMATISNSLGIKTLNIVPTKITSEELAEDPFKEKLTKVNFTVNKGGFWITKSLFLRHYIYNLLVDHASVYTYNPTGKHNIYIRSNCDWIITNINDPKGFLDIKTTDNLRVNTIGSYNVTTGKKLTFNIKQYNTQNGFVSITFSSFNGEFEDRIITFEVNPLF